MIRPIEYGQNGLAFKRMEELVSANGYASFSLRVAVRKPNHFVTACLTFHRESVDKGANEILDYGEITLASFTADIQKWQDLAVRLTAGNLPIGSIQPAQLLAYSDFREDAYLQDVLRPPRESFIFKSSSQESNYSQRPLLAIGQPPFANLSDAAARYVHRARGYYGNTPFDNELVIEFPSYGPLRIAEWLPGRLMIQLFDQALPKQLDVLFWRGSEVTSSQSISNPQRELEMRVPAGTTSVGGHLLSDAGKVIQSFVLRAPYSFVGEPSASLSEEQQTRTAILAGENETREMKAFFNPDENREMRDRVLHSAIALANTLGGQIYVGVEDSGDLSGNAKLTRALRKGIPAECADELATRLRKFILENTRPVVEVEARRLSIEAEWIVKLSIESSAVIVSNHQNEIFIRMGASNRRPPAEWFQQRTQAGKPTFTIPEPY